jgi:2-phospho-L-lactate transferase/gluconeogenesis factor (CofD/UPF0052 family)
MNVVIFTGGNGNANLIKYLKDISYVNLSLLINGYDDGLSTGVIRKANYGMLGPSDFRKNFTYILDEFSETNSYLKGLFEHRLSDEEALLLKNSHKSLIYKLINATYPIGKSDFIFIIKYFELGASRLLDFTDNLEDLVGFSVGNIIIGGIYSHTQDFNLALEILTTQFDITAKLINVSTNDDSKLVAFDNNKNFLINESDIVNYSGDNPLSDFFMLPLNQISLLDNHINYDIEQIKKLAIVPQISKEALLALESADLIVFGSGTQFSSLLPSYRICQQYIVTSKAKKILIINNKFDNDIRNITFDKLLNLILNEIKIDDINFFDSIIIDNDSSIKPINIYNNLIIASVANQIGKHDGQKLWAWITKSLDYKNGQIPVSVYISDKTDTNIISHYKNEIDILNNDESRTIKFYLNDNYKFKTSYQLFLDATGKISLSEIDLWINIIQLNQIDGVIGSRFDSRRQLIHSFKNSLVESNYTYYFALITSYVVSLLYFVRFWKIIPDPLSGIYLIKSNNIKYYSIHKFLKEINKINRFQLISLPIGYRTFNRINIFLKIKNVFVNLIKLYV